ncbi:hypothetical protein [Paraburkholderia aromaticivorans]|uniref:hypothetical protein n=1 Tax=Paraburkholderia aromaticivorans TaxID=2026199 RepID=UPI001456110D|nr:hypothetical protein [Paraburkholderia aromaticivorans]
MLVSPIKAEAGKRLRFLLNAAAEAIRRCGQCEKSKGKKDAGKTVVKREAQRRGRLRAAMRRQQNDSKGYANE